MEDQKACRVQERQLSLSYVVTYPEAEIHRHILVCSITLIPLDMFCKYLVGMKRRTSWRVASKGDNSQLRYVVISPEVEILCRQLPQYCLR